jgi:30S ribosomal protein S31
MGRGDKRTRRGKTFKGSYGNARPQGVESVKVESVKKVAAQTPASNKKTTTTKKTK